MVNVYRPGAGQMPLYLAGRDAVTEEINQVFDALKDGVPVQSVIYYGLRGVGKTVLINSLERNAEAKGIFCKHIEMEFKNDFLMQITTCAQMYLRQFSKQESVKHLITKAIEALKSLVISYDPTSTTFSLSMEEKELYRTSDISQNLSELFSAIGQIAQNAGMPICFFIDEMQYLDKKELGAFITALHRSNQLGYPVMAVGAGLPRLVKLLSDVRSYSERLFIYKEIGSLSKEQAKLAIINPAKRLDIAYCDEATDEIFNITKGYPFFIQQFCQTMFNNDVPTVIRKTDVQNTITEYYEILDAGFFQSRYERCSDGERKFIFAMTDCGSLPCTISGIAEKMNKDVKSISPVRAKLIDKGIIYPVRHSELDFTVPDFDKYIGRLRERIHST